MKIEIYELDRERAGRIPGFYFPGVARRDLPNGVRINGRAANLEEPKIFLDIDPDSISNLTLYTDAPLIHYVELLSIGDENFPVAKRKLEDALGFKLDGSEI